MSHYRNQRLLDSAKDQPCVICESIGTTVSAHANSVALGKGMGIKVPDYYTVHACQRHHDMIDGRIKVEPPYRDAFDLWTWAFIKTVARWFNQGIVKC